MWHLSAAWKPEQISQPRDSNHHYDDAIKASLPLKKKTQTLAPNGVLVFEVREQCEDLQ